MSLLLSVFDWWESGTTQPSIPVNDNALRTMISMKSAVSDAITVQPTFTSPDDDGLWYVIPAGATGTFWGTFSENSCAIFFGGTWYEFVPQEGDIVGISGQLYEFSPSNGWSLISGGGGSGNKFVNVALSDMTTDLTTGTAKGAWFAPEGGSLVSVYIGVHDPSSSGIVRVDMNDAGGTVFTTRPSIDATEATSITGTQAVLDGTISFSRGDKFTFDIDDAGADAKGLQICIEYNPA
jgi:hypothetical protein